MRTILNPRFWTIIVAGLHIAAGVVLIGYWGQAAFSLQNFGLDVSAIRWPLTINLACIYIILGLGLLLSLTALFRGGARTVRAFLLLGIIALGAVGAWSLDIPILAAAQAGPALLTLVGMFLRA